MRRLTDAIMAENPWYAIVAIDEEGGDVTRLFAAAGAPFPGNAVLGRLDDLEITRDTAAAIGWSLRPGRLHGQLRSLCRRQQPVRQPDHRRAQLFQRPGTGGKARGSLGGWPPVDRRSGKRQAFPGHGDTAQDSHVSLPVVNRSLDQLRSHELLPFVAAINENCRVVMTSHILVPQLDRNNPATMSRSSCTTCCAESWASPVWW